jgi:hypothetical protein
MCNYIERFTISRGTLNDTHYEDDLAIAVEVLRTIDNPEGLRCSWSCSCTVANCSILVCASIS